MDIAFLVVIRRGANVRQLVGKGRREQKFHLTQLRSSTKNTAFTLFHRDYQSSFSYSLLLEGLQIKIIHVSCNLIMFVIHNGCRQMWIISWCSTSSSNLGK